MKLQSVTFVTAVLVPGVGSVSSLTAAQVDISYDKSLDVVVIGNDGTEVPRSRVVCWKRDRRNDVPQAKMPCSTCLREFNDARALGAHSRHAHGISGASRGRGAQ